MADRRSRRQQARRSRQKARREQKRQQRRRGGELDIGAGARWPLREAWIGADWHDGVSRCPAFAFRQHEDGRTVWLTLVVDLSDGTLLEVSTGSGTEPQARGALGALTDDGETPLLSTEASSLAALLRDSLDRTVAPPSGVRDVQRLLADADPDASPLAVRFGFDTPTDPGATRPRREGWLGGLLRRITGG